jgi:hypothetical protein
MRLQLGPALSAAVLPTLLLFTTVAPPVSPPSATVPSPVGVADLTPIAIGVSYQGEMGGEPEIEKVGVKIERREWRAFNEKTRTLPSGQIEQWKAKLTWKGTLAITMRLGVSSPVPLVIASSSTDQTMGFAVTTADRITVRAHKLNLSRTVKIDADANDRSSEFNQQSLNAAKAELYGGALKRIRVAYSPDGVRMVVCRIENRDGQLLLSPASAEPLAGATWVSDQVKAAVTLAVEAIGRFERECDPIGTSPIPVTLPTHWDCQRRGIRASEIEVWSGCWHCSNRPSIHPGREHLVATCAGCRHIVGCDGNPAECEACALGVSKLHRVTIAEARLWEEAVERAIERIPDCDSCVQSIQVPIPCGHHHPATRRKPAVEISWDAWIAVRLGPIPADLVQLASVDSDRVGSMAPSSARPLGPGMLEVSFATQFEEKLWPADAAARPQRGTIARIESSDGSSRGPTDALRGLDFIFKAKDGRFSRYRFDAKSGALVFEKPSFGFWQKLVNWQPPRIALP